MARWWCLSLLLVALVLAQHTTSARKTPDETATSVLHNTAANHDVPNNNNKGTGVKDKKCGLVGGFAALGGAAGIGGVGVIPVLGGGGAGLGGLGGGAGGLGGLGGGAGGLGGLGGIGGAGAGVGGGVGGGIAKGGGLVPLP